MWEGDAFKDARGARGGIRDVTTVDRQKRMEPGSDKGTNKD